MKKLIFFLVSLIIFNCGVSEKNYKNYNDKLSDVIETLQIKNHTIYVLIDKSDYTLSIISDTIIIKEYPIVLGGNPIDDKLTEGDQCTPEGIFYIRSKYPHKTWSKFIWINYPTKDSWAKHRSAKQKGDIPKDASIGGEIGIHGVPDGMDMLIDLKQNWTLGCISLKNKDVNEIYPYITKSTKIEIRK